MITVVMPTMWRTPELKSSIEIMEQSPYITRIQLINNAKSAFFQAGINTWGNTKIRVYTPPENIYITASWNHGVLHADTDIVCLLNDDVVLPAPAWEFIANNWPEDAGIVGLGFNSLHILGGAYHLRATTARGYGFGAAMFIRRKNYLPIPEDLKLWFNDDWLFKYIPGQHYYMEGPFTGRMSATTDDPEFNEIKRQDAINWKKYE